MHIEIGQVISQIVAFLLMLWLLKKFGWKPLLEILEERQKKIHEGFEEIAAEQRNAKQLAADYEKKLMEIETEARHRIQQAITEGREMAAGIQKEAQTQAKILLEQSKKDIEGEIGKAREVLKKDIVSMVMQTTEKVLQKRLDEEGHEKLITDFVEEAGLK